MPVPNWITDIASEVPILIAGPTASGKSSLALAIARDKGGCILNADAMQVYKNWRILTARPNPEEEKSVPHALYGHLDGTQEYSVGAWLEDIKVHLCKQQRPIIVGGTGLYFKALTSGLASIPSTPPNIRNQATEILKREGLKALIADLDNTTRMRLDLQNPMRVQRAWEVLKNTRRSIAQWQDETPAPLLKLENCLAIKTDADKEWLNHRIEKRFHEMLKSGVLEEVKKNAKAWNPKAPFSKAIGAKQLISYLAGDLKLREAKELAITATRQLAKRQRTWFRNNMPNWHSLDSEKLCK